MTDPLFRILLSTAVWSNLLCTLLGTWTTYVHADAKRVGSITTWMHRDHLASVRLVISATGAQSERANYRPYGQQFPGLSQSKGWIGEKFDPETGLQYLHARWYDPALARFLTPDDWELGQALAALRVSPR